jgi:hypothetical protein
LADAIVAREGELGDYLQRYTSARAERIAAIPRRIRQQLAYQKEAVGTALSLAEFDRTTLQLWDPPERGVPRSFLDGLQQARMREDAMVFTDSSTFPGFERIRAFMHGAAVFENAGGVRLTIIVANRQPLEELTGADLIYYNESFSSFVMVQYKAMETEGEGEPIYRLPNTQLDEEISRMEGVIEAIRPAGAPIDHRGFRFSFNPFFLKLCSRLVFQPDDVSLMPGMYIPLEKWKLLANSAALIGRRGGRGVTFNNVERHLDNTHFAALVANAWVGTTPAQSRILQDAVLTTLESGRAAVIALRSETLRGRAGLVEGRLRRRVRR